MNNVLNMINEYAGFIIIGLVVIILLLFVMVLSLLKSTNRLERKYRKLMRGVDNKNLENMLTEKIESIDSAVELSKQVLEECESIKVAMKDCVNKVAIMRYKAFENVGSDLSFSIAILDAHNDGVMITGIYARNESTTYAKPIDKGISRYDLSEEEIHVLNEAINKR